MSSDKHWVDSSHYRTVSSDGKTSYLHESKEDFFSTDRIVEVAKHHSDGTTDAYENDDSFFGSGHGSHK